MDDAPHILVVDDHRDIRDSLVRTLKAEGLRANAAETAAQARKILKTRRIDLILLDVMMPGEDGLSLCRSIVETSGVPVILLTARVEETDRIVGLEMGADDYVTKPFSPRELIARIKAVLRRTRALPPGQRPPEAETLRFAGWTLHVSQRNLETATGVTVPLSTGEFRLLMVFLAHPRIVLSRDQLLDLTRGRDAGPFDRSIDNQVSRLRRKIEEDPKDPQIIKTVWGGGYSFSAAVERGDAAA
ncbi:MAG: response regulator [Alphaproteobacteria bacterium]